MLNCEIAIYDLETDHVITERKNRLEMRTEFLIIGELKPWKGLPIDTKGPNLVIFKSFIK